METQSKKAPSGFDDYALPSGHNEFDYVLNPGFEKIDEFKKVFQNFQLSLDHLLARFIKPRGKTSFLVFKHNKYTTIPTENIAFFYVKYESSFMMCFDQQEYSVNYSLEQIQSLLTNKEFFRLNRQYLISFDAVKEVEPYFTRKLLVNLVIPALDQLLVSREKASSFLEWLENR